MISPMSKFSKPGLPIIPPPAASKKHKKCPCFEELHRSPNRGIIAFLHLAAGTPSGATSSSIPLLMKILFLSKISSGNWQKYCIHRSFVKHTATAWKKRPEVSHLRSTLKTGSFSGAPCGCELACSLSVYNISPVQEFDFT